MSTLTLVPGDSNKDIPGITSIKIKNTSVFTI